MNTILAPIIVPLVGAMLCILGRDSLIWQRLVSFLVSAALPFIAWSAVETTRIHGVQVLRVGDWPGPFGIVFALDSMGALMIFFASLTQFATWLFLVLGGAKAEGQRQLMLPLLLILGGAVNWAFSTGDIFNLFVSFEILLIASYALTIHGNGSGQVREGFKFVVVNLLAGMLFLAASGFAYGAFGSLNMAELAVRIHMAGTPPAAIVLATMLILVFGMKAAIFPLFFWLPDTYPKVPYGIVAYFSGILTKVGVYALYRTITLFIPQETFVEWFQTPLLAIAGLTMFIGVMGAYSQYTFRRILSFHIVSQIGYMIFGLAIYTPLALAFGIFYVVHNMVVKSALLMVADTVAVNQGSDDLKKVRGLIHISPWLAIVFLVAALSLAGIPPFSGFFGKFGFAWEGFREGHYLTVAVAILTGLFTLASMVKIWRYSFWGPREEAPAGPLANGQLSLAPAFLVAAALALSIGSGWFLTMMKDSGTQLLDRREYVAAVIGRDAARLLDTPLREVAISQP